MYLSLKIKDSGHGYRTVCGPVEHMLTSILSVVLYNNCTVQDSTSILLSQHRITAHPAPVWQGAGLCIQEAARRFVCQG